MHSQSTAIQLPLFVLGKTCSQCGQHKPIAEFGHSRRAKDGYRGVCKRCRALDPLAYDDAAACRAAGVKRCSVCGELHPLSAFAARRRVCPPCRAARARDFYRRHKERITAWRQRRYALALVSPIGPAATKACCHCGRQQPLTAYRVCGTRRDGRDVLCNGCRAVRARHWRQNHLEVARERRRRSYARHGERERASHRAWLEAHKADVQAYKRLYRAAHADEIRAAWERWYRENRESLRPRRALARRRYYLANREKYIHAAKVRQAITKARGGTLRASDIRVLFAAQNGCCAYCGCLLPPTFHIEHKVPLARGGRSDPENICLACPACNLAKGTKTDAEFRARDASCFAV
jgi:hypothetical protein